MEFEDSKKAIFYDKNAYIQRFQKRENKEIKKIVFSEPYETVPNYYLNNNFTKHDCDCVSKPNKHDCNCNHNTYSNKNNNRGCGFNNNLGYGKENWFNQSNRDDDCHNDKPMNNGFGFDLKNLMPLFRLFNKGSGTDLSQLVGLLNNVSNTQIGNNSNPMNMISSILSNKDAMGGILNMFKGGGLNLFNKKPKVTKQVKTTDFEIKNYTRVE